ncbi:MAG: porin family protein [Prevotella sp.]
MTENWKQQLQQKMDSFEKAAPELSWSEIDKALKTRAAAAQPTKARIIPLWTKRIASAAAVALIVITGANMFFTKDEGNTLLTPQKGFISHQAAKESATPLNERMTSVKELAVTEKTTAVVKNPIHDTEEELITEQPEVEETKTAEEPKVEKTTKKAHAANQDYRYLALTEQPDNSARKKRHSGLAADLHVQGLMGANNSGNNVADMGLLMSDAPTYSNGKMQLQGMSYPLMSLNKRELSYDHDLPIKVGISLRYNINDRWSVLTGITYSYLHSTFIVNDNSNNYGSQKLHYMGIPMAASFNVWKNDKLKFYITAGGTVEKLLKGNMNETLPSGDEENVTLSEKRLQWSVQGAVGMEYDITPAFGLYLEPGVSHHFDNHSDIQSIYKDKPWNFSLNFGFRLNLK